MTDQKRDEGFTLIEILVTALIVGLVIVSVSTLFILAMKVNASAGDQTECSTLAQARMESLNRVPYDSLLQGGDLDGCAAGYCEYVDMDGDGRNDYQVSWAVEWAGDPSSKKSLSGAKINITHLKVQCKTLRGSTGSLGATNGTAGSTGQVKKVYLKTYRSRGVE